MSYKYPDTTRQELLDLIPADGQVIGSIGCGAGGTEAELVRRGRQVHAVDIAPEAVELARPKLTSVRLIQPDNHEPFEPDSLDGLILADVIEHVPAGWEYLASVAAAVRPGGWVVISVPNMRYCEAVWQFVVRGDWPEHPTGIFDSTHLQVMTKRRLGRWCAAAGLTVERWFDRYHPDPKRRRVSVVIDALTLRLFHQFFMFQVQVVCRRPAVAAAPAGSAR